MLKFYRFLYRADNQLF